MSGEAKVSNDKGEKIIAELQAKNADIVFVIARSKNANIVVYEALRTEDKKHLNSKSPLDVYWLDIDPEYVKKARAKGKQDDREDLNMFEKQFAYGIKVEATGDGAYKISLVALPARIATLFMTPDGKAQLNIEISGKQCRLQRIYVHSVERTLRPPKVEYVELFGIDPSTGAQAYEKIIPK